MSYVIDEEGYAVLDESAFLGWDSSRSSDSGRTEVRSHNQLDK